MRTSRAFPSRRGFALLAALALLTLVGVVSVTVTSATRPRQLATAGIADRLAGTEAATAGVEHARALLLQLDEDGAAPGIRTSALAMDPWQTADGAVVGPVPIRDWQYRVELHDANALLHLDLATEEQLRLLLAALRVDARRAARLAAAIADWRDGDELRRVNGAERADYLRDGRVLMPEDAPFSSMGELRVVAGMTDSLYDVVRPHLTLFGSGRVNVNTAGRPVLMTLPGMTGESAAALLRNRRAGRPTVDLYRFADQLSPGARRIWRNALPRLLALTTVDTREMHVLSEAWQPGGITRVRIDAVLAREADARVTWRRVLP